jgi:hypothetical protein
MERRQRGGPSTAHSRRDERMACSGAVFHATAGFGDHLMDSIVVPQMWAPHIGWIGSNPAVEVLRVGLADYRALAFVASRAL